MTERSPRDNSLDERRILSFQKNVKEDTVAYRLAAGAPLVQKHCMQFRSQIENFVY